MCVWERVRACACVCLFVELTVPEACLVSGWPLGTPADHCSLNPLETCRQKKAIIEEHAEKLSQRQAVDFFFSLQCKSQFHHT